MDRNLRVSSGAISDRGLSEKRPQNEDSYLEMNSIGIFAVADGVGGAQAGEVASQMSVEILGEAFANKSAGADAEGVMRTAVERANTAIFQMARDLPQLASMATTIVALHLDGNIATIGHVGDSRLYRVDRDGSVYRETEDHSMVAEEVRAGRMTEQQAENHPSKNIISRALGAEATVDIDLKTIMIEPGNAFLLCSDGITRHVADQEIKGVLTFGGSPAEICEYLKNLCYERGAEDNLTAVVVKVAANEAETSKPANINILDFDEPTVATARSSFDDTIPDNDDVLLELETQPLVTPEVIPEPVAHSETEEIENDVPIADGEEVRTAEISIEQLPPSAVHSEPASAERADSFSMFNDSGASEIADDKSNSLGKLASAAAMLLIGGIVGLAVYHFGFAPSITNPAPPPMTEMRSANIPLSAFEENRRNVDKDPAGYAAKFGSSPQDSEDFYLVGRAYLLSGDFTKARESFTESRNRLAEADPANARILASDIAMALAVTNDTTIQSMLKKEFDATPLPPSNSNSDFPR